MLKQAGLEEEVEACAALPAMCTHPQGSLIAQGYTKSSQHNRFEGTSWRRGGWHGQLSTPKLWLASLWQEIFKWSKRQQDPILWTRHNHMFSPLPQGLTSFMREPLVHRLHLFFLGEGLADL